MVTNKFKTYLGVGIAIFFSLVMLISAISILRQPKYIETIGTIVSVSNTCTSDVCKTTVKFKAKGTEYTRDFQLGSPKVNTTLPIYFTEDSPPIVSTSPVPSKRFGIILLVLSILFIVLSVGIMYFAKGFNFSNSGDMPGGGGPNSNQLNQNLDAAAAAQNKQ